MKLKAMRSLCKAAGRLELIDYEAEDGTIEQWIGCGRCAWPVDGLPYLTLNNVERLLELGAKDMEGIEAEHLHVEPGRLRHGDEQEVPLAPSGLELEYFGERFMLLTACDGRLWMLNKALLASKNNGWDPVFYWRPDLKYIAVKNGLMLEGVVLPEDLRAEVLRELVKNLSGYKWQIGEYSAQNGETYEQEEFETAGLPGDDADGLPSQRAEEDLRVQRARHGDR